MPSRWVGVNPGNAKFMRWKARAKVDGCDIYLGTFDTWREAADMERAFWELYYKSVAEDAAEDLLDLWERRKRERP